MKKPPRFFCDNCGEEVDSSVKACPECGRFFSSVRCPSCGFSGEDRLFQNGCPCCGYSAAPMIKNKQKRKKQRVDHHLPAWTFIVSAIVLIALIAFLAHYITR